MEGFLNILHLIKDKLKDLCAKAKPLLELLDNNERIQETEILILKLDSLVKRLSTELTNYFRFANDTAPDDISEITTVQLEAEDLLCELRVKLKGKLTEKEDKVKEGGEIMQGKLPKLSLPQFDGNVLEWHTFWDQFNCNIHKRKLSDVDKLLYLKSSLKGKAKEDIDGLETTGSNYQIALQCLKERYGNTSQVIDAHYSALYKIKPANDDVHDCRRALNELERHLRVLSSLGEDITHNHLRFLVMEKFPNDIVYELKLKKKEQNIQEIRENLATVISAREDANRITQMKDTSNINNYTVETLHTTNKYKPAETEGRKFYKKFQERRGNYNREQRTFNKNDNFKRQRNFSQRENNEMTNRKRKFTPRSTTDKEGPEKKRSKANCVFCKGQHYSDECKKFKTIKERKSQLKNKCYNCFDERHFSRNCISKRVCYHCNKFGKHHRALCPEKEKKINSQKGETANTLHVNERGLTVLQTAVVTAINEKDASRNLQCRVLLDSGSQRTYITKTAADKLNLDIEERSNLIIFTFGNKIPQELDSPVVKLQLKTRTNRTLQIHANVVPNITHSVPYPLEQLSKLENKQILADDGSLSDNVDILIGNDYYFSLISTQKIKIKKDLYLVDSELGYILSGKLDSKPENDLSVITYFQAGTEYKFHKPDLPLDQGSVTTLWDLESIGITDSPKTSREEEAVNNFNETTEIIENRYTVSWPWTEYPPSLSTNYGLAYGRLVNLLKRLDKETLESYDKTLREQIDKGIIETVSNPDVKEDHPIHYLPHHCVHQKGKPIRIVYDASSKIKDSKSLNECLYCGPMMLEDLTGLLIRFRYHQVALSADVEKAFLQVSLHKNDRDVTRFLWIKNLAKPATKDNIITMRFCRVPFGVISSPFLLNATIKHHLTNCDKPEIKSIANQIYVDNLVTGTSSVNKALQLYKDAKEVFQQISMNLREWSSNSEEFMHQISDTSKDTIVKILGLDWDLKDDTLQLRFKTDSKATTKREVLRVIASIYDPCGFVVPYVLSAKLILQELWKTKIKWDAPLPKERMQEWEDTRKNLDEIKEVSVPRRYIKNSTNKDYQIHCFTDASLKAYAAVVYIWNDSKVSFVIGKSRLVPIKDQDQLKIPRLELLGVLIGSRLIKFVLKALPVLVSQQTIWTDSQIVIEWCKSNKLLPPFVSRRVQEIKQNKELIIRYVPSELNPADVATRPTVSKEDKERWLFGPNFLQDDSKTWPSNRSSDFSFLSREVLPKEPGHKEIMPVRDVEQRMEIDQDVEKPREEVTNMEETQERGQIVNNKIEEIKKLQAKYFSEELEGKETHLKRNLGLYTDVDGILRCKGRFKNTDWPYDKRYPILIPKDCDFTSRVITQTHNDNYHVGANHTLSIIRQKFWIPQGKSQVQKIIRKCPRCVKHGGGPFKLPVTPALPPERVNYSSPFTFTGLDYLGPIQVKSGNTLSKCWIALFTCLAVRAVHLEVVQDLTAEEGLLALRRMISTRGLPQLVTSDNATNFKLMSEILSNSYCIKNEIKWRFIPQLAPWFGGFYERLIGIVKNCMKKTLQKHLLTNSQLCTVVKEIEAVVNSRPLTCVDTELIHILKPSDFLTLSKCITTRKSYEDIPIQGTTTKSDLIASWRRGLTILEEFKDMFSNRYLTSLRERYGHSHKEPKVTSKLTPVEGQVVQIKGDSKNREGWKVGKITSLPKGADGLIRVAKVKVDNKEFVRSLAHLYPLEIEEETEKDYCKASSQKENSETEEIPQINLESMEFEDSASENSNQEQENVEKVSENVESLIKDNVNESTDGEINSNKEVHEPERPEEEPRHRRGAATRALEKIRMWTQNLVSLLCFGRECRDNRDVQH